MRVQPDTCGEIAIAPKRYPNRLVGDDAARRRAWVRGQRLDHGPTAAPFAGMTTAGVAAHRPTARGGVEWTLFGSDLMAHDRSLWFQRGAEEAWD